jgi:hypothetical protein
LPDVGICVLPVGALGDADGDALAEGEALALGGGDGEPDGGLALAGEGLAEGLAAAEGLAEVDADALADVDALGDGPGVIVGCGVGLGAGLASPIGSVLISKNPSVPTETACASRSSRANTVSIWSAVTDGFSNRITHWVPPV